MRALVLLLFGAVAGCQPDPACKPLLEHSSQLAVRLEIPGEFASNDTGLIGPDRSLNPAGAERLLKEVERMKTELPASAADEDLNMLLWKLGNQRAALEQSLRDFLAIDPKQLEKGLESGVTMPVRRGVTMSRNAVVSLAATASTLCAGKQ
jgi:hypothetical protein